MSDTATNHSFSNDFDYSPCSDEPKYEILTELWKTYKDYPQFDFTDLISYGNSLDVFYTVLGVKTGVDELTDKSKSVIQEVFVMFLAKLGLTDEYSFVDLEDVFTHREILLAKGEIK
jgi:hypothetical protein